MQRSRFVIQNRFAIQSRFAIPSLTLVLAVALAAPALAGVHYKATTTLDNAGGRGSGKMLVEGWASGGKAKVDIKESISPLTPSGAYLLTRDGGHTLYLVNPEDKTYAEWNLDAMMGAMGGILQGMGPLLKFEFSEPKVEKLLDEDGGTVVGLPTRHLRYRTSYSMKMKVFGLGSGSEVVSEQDVWATTKLEDAALGVWLRSDPPRTGNPQLDKLIAAEREKLTGFPLKTVTVTTTTQKGRQSVSRQTMEVTELGDQAIADSAFEIPAGYKETQILPVVPPSE